MKKNYLKATGLVFSFFVLAGHHFSAWATIYPFHRNYSGANEVPANASTAKGAIVGTYNDQTNTISYTIIFSGLTMPASAAHFHAPALPGTIAPVIIGYTGFPNATAGVYTNSNVLTDAQEVQLFSGLMYSNIHNATFQGGEIRTQMILGDQNTTSPFRLTYTGAQEVPSNASTATGMIIGSYNHSNNTISYSIIFSGLSAPASAAHFHAPAVPGVIAPVIIGYTGFPNAVSGFYSNSNVLTDAQETQLLAGLMYTNIHNSIFQGGEIRTQMLLTDVLPPTISNVAANPSELWPPNHKMKDAAVSYTSSDDFPQAVTCRLSVSSNEPVTSENDDTSPDWLVVNSNTVQVRAERSGEGSGRVYTITVTCTDAQGNLDSKSTTVTVAHDPSYTVSRQTSEVVGAGLWLKVFPNPGKDYFAVDIQGNNSEKISVKIFDMAGRVVHSKTNLVGNQSFRVGSELKAGIYFLEVQQGKEIKKMKLVKL